MRRPRSNYHEYCKRYQLDRYSVGLTAEEEAACVERKDYNTLVLANMRLAIRWALRFREHAHLLDDLIQSSLAGLVYAAHLFDPSQSRFTTYASYWCRRRIYDLLRLHNQIPLAPDDDEKSDNRTIPDKTLKTLIDKEQCELALSGMTKRERKLLKRRILDGQSYRHIAAKRRISGEWARLQFLELLERAKWTYHAATQKK